MASLAHILVQMKFQKLVLHTNFGFVLMTFHYKYNVSVTRNNPKFISKMNFGRKVVSSKIFKHYLKELWIHRNSCSTLKSTSFILMYDNAKIHIAEIVREFIANSKLRSICIPSYSPICNAAKKLINSIKQHIKILHFQKCKCFIY